MPANDLTKDFPENPGPMKEPKLPVPEPTELPTPDAEPLPDLEPLAKEKPEEPAKLAELANKLYDSATKMQRDTEALMNAIKTDEAPIDSVDTKAPEPMAPEEADAAEKALIGL